MNEAGQEEEVRANSEREAGAQRGVGGPAGALPFLVGGLVEAGDLLRGWVQGEVGERPAGNESARHAAVGLTANSAERFHRRARAATKLSRRVGHLLFAPGRVMARSRPLRPLRRRFDRLVERGEAEVESWIVKGRETESSGREMARAALGRSTQEIAAWASREPAVAELIDNQVARIVPELVAVPQMDQAIQRLADSYLIYLSQQPPEALEALLRAQIQWAIADLYRNPPPALRQLVREQVREILPELPTMEAVDDLVREVADNYIEYLSEHPEKVQALIQNQGDVYITYLTQHPEQVQTLIQGQSKGLVSEVTDEVRARTVTADTVLESLVRSLLRREKRQEIAAERGLDEVEGE